MATPSISSAPVTTTLAGASAISAGAGIEHPLRKKILETLKTTAGIPAFAATAHQLQHTVHHENVDEHAAAQVIKLDPGLAATYLRTVNSIGFGGDASSNLEDALFIMGLDEIRKLAPKVEFLNQNEFLRAKVCWDMFRLHSILVARLTEKIAGAYRFTTGKEYLAGLLHDAGKIFLREHFPQEFEAVLELASARRCGMAEAETQLLGITHAEISSVLCEKWGLDREIVRAVRFHHDPSGDFQQDPFSSTGRHFLATCVCVADSLANFCQANIPGAKDMSGMEMASLPEWILLQEFTPQSDLQLDPFEELQVALAFMMGDTTPVNSPSQEWESAEAPIFEEMGR